MSRNSQQLLQWAIPYHSFNVTKHDKTHDTLFSRKTILSSSCYWDRNYGNIYRGRQIHAHQKRKDETILLESYYLLELVVLVKQWWQKGISKVVEEPRRVMGSHGVISMASQTSAITSHNVLVWFYLNLVYNLCKITL